MVLSIQSGSDKQQQKLNPSFLWEFVTAFSHTILSTLHWKWQMDKSLGSSAGPWLKLCLPGTKARGLLIKSVTSLGHACDRFISLCLHALTLTKQDNSCYTYCCCKGKKGPENWVKHTNPCDLHVSSYIPGYNSGSEHLRCVWEEPCSVYLFNRANHSTFHPVQAWLYHTAWTRARLCSITLSKPRPPPQPLRQTKNLCRERTEAKRKLKHMVKFPLWKVGDVRLRGKSDLALHR